MRYLLIILTELGAGRFEAEARSCTHVHIHIERLEYILRSEQTRRCAKVVARVGVERVHAGVVRLIISKLVTARIHPCTSGHGRMCALNYLHGG